MQRLKPIFVFPLGMKTHKLQKPKSKIRKISPRIGDSPTNFDINDYTSPRISDGNQEKILVRTESTIEKSKNLKKKLIRSPSNYTALIYNTNNQIEITKSNLVKIKEFIDVKTDAITKSDMKFQILKTNCKKLFEVLKTKDLEALEKIEKSIDEIGNQAGLIMRVQAKKLKTICQELRTIFADLSLKSKNYGHKTRESYERRKSLEMSWEQENSGDTPIPSKSISSFRESSKDFKTELQRLFYSNVIEIKLKYSPKDPCQQVSISKLYAKSHNLKIPSIK